MINRIILIGNGFDLAHEMKTTYRDFINDYWSKAILEYKTSLSEKYSCEIFDVLRYAKSSLPLETYADLVSYDSFLKLKLNFKNSFFSYITDTMYDSNWGGIEALYYQRLKIAMRDNTHKEIAVLNEEFEVVKKLLNDYLFSQQLLSNTNKLIQDHISLNIFEGLSFRDFSEAAKEYVIEKLMLDLKKKHIDVSNEINAFYNTIETKYKIINENAIRDYLTRISDDILKSEIFYTTILSFNYTSTDMNYCRENTQSIHIHGELNSVNNPMIFGYGDELDDVYNEIEKLGNNDYLENIKSINYSKTDNYKKLLETINSGFYQIYVMGHSCDVSDRTLLNTIFEHDNCAGIKIFYYENKEWKNNYIDVYKNISRNFNDKRKLRDRVVNYMHSQALIPASLLEQIESSKSI